MLNRKKYADALDESMQMYVDLMKKCWGEAPELEPKVEVVLKVSMDFDLGDFPHQGQVFYISPDKEVKLAPDKVAKKIVQEINSHRNHCNRCGVPVPHVYSRQYGVNERIKAGTVRNWRTGQMYTEEEILAYDIPSDELERTLHPVLSRKLDKRLVDKRNAERDITNPMYKAAYDKEMNEWFGEGVNNYV